MGQVHRQVITRGTSRLAPLGTLALCIGMGLGLTACSSSPRQSAALQQVDDLLGRIERFQAETERTRERAQKTLASLQVLFDESREAEPLREYEEFVEALELSRQQAYLHRKAFEEMKQRAEPFFFEWQLQLESFANPSMRRRSQQRLTQTRGRYSSIERLGEPALSNYESINIALGDCAVFLGRDFHPDAVQMIRKDAHRIAGRTGRLELQLEGCLEATREYVRESGFDRGEGEPLVDPTSD